VWFPDGVPVDSLYLDESVGITPRALSAADPAHAPAIAHALGQLDRAVILDTSGRLLQANVTLSNSEAAASRNFTGGTRHNSAGRYSVSDGRGFVFVVSADGPVTVLRSGNVIASSGTLD
jgi:DNA integrity scanning protein DisA with diadenylate cyclase activity